MKQARNCLYNEAKSKLNMLLNVIIAIVVLIFAIEICFTVNYSGVYVVHGSMKPTLIGADSDDVIGGDYIYINKHAKPTYGDIVVVSVGENEFFIKRAIAFGGDRVKLVEGKLFIKYKGKTEFELVPEQYIDANYNNPALKVNNFPDDESGYLVKDGHFLLMGDNRNESRDSRAMGSFPLSRLDGVATKWSIEHKSFCTAVYNYFKFQLPSYFGLKRSN